MHHSWVPQAWYTLGFDLAPRCRWRGRRLILLLAFGLVFILFFVFVFFREDVSKDGPVVGEASLEDGSPC